MRILHLYPSLMNLYGEYGNIVVLKKHLEDQGIDVVVDKKEIEDEVFFDDYDMIYMGSGTENNFKVALEHLKKYKNDLKIFVEDGKVVLFTGNAMELCFKKIDEEEGLGLVDYSSKIVDKRYTGDVIVENQELGQVVGFVNKSSLIEGNGRDSLFKYLFKDDNLVDNDYEGYRYKNLFGTHIIGPILIKNPSFMKKIVTLLSAKEYKEFVYEYEEKSHQITLEALKGRMDG